MSFKTLLLPGDTPPRRSRIKRLLLFSDSVILIDPSDKAVVNDGEIVEQFPNMTIRWTSRGPFPRSNDYEDVMKNILAETVGLQRDGRIQILKPTGYSEVDPGINWTLHQSALSNEALVRASVPDMLPSVPEPKPPTGVYTGMAMAQSGYKSKYDIGFKTPFDFPAMKGWTGYAWGRLGRAIKFIRRAYGLDAYPIAVDPINNSILQAIGNLTFEVSPKPDLLAQMTIATWVEPEKLEAALIDMSWTEVIRLRKEVLPAIGSLRTNLTNKVQELGLRAAKDMDAYVREFGKIKQEYEVEKEKLADAWEKLKLGGALKLSGAIAGGYGLNLFAGPMSWIDLTQKIIGLGAAAGAALSPEITALVPARRKVLSHPLFVFEKIRGS
ncbi:MAG: hypothetical protein WC687_04445 [Patescibacteria group bacterium]|jgi:hypothetical protein